MTAGIAAPVEAYRNGWAHREAGIETIGDMAYAFFSFHLEGETAVAPESFVVAGRNTLIARRSGDEWKGIHYHESLRGPCAEHS
ncbi:nuclear transport factor 2 family protein [Nocardia flavorosea]|uniref:SnoaL-like domain-containing protein n=1 Tax=Nocardia flavorosea TaxID=53429 RepID=A0A846Y8Y8_9NOCA|nr:nuclear transport factor 2 family protein [Nocardia flavorosea]NKY55623.1 SnoaL-like domain-containing protein [Nocardia flavorosea]